MTTWAPAAVGEPVSTRRPRPLTTDTSERLTIATGSVNRSTTAWARSGTPRPPAAGVDPSSLACPKAGAALAEQAGQAERRARGPARAAHGSPGAGAEPHGALRRRRHAIAPKAKTSAAAAMGTMSSA